MEDNAAAEALQAAKDVMVLRSSQAKKTGAKITDEDRQNADVILVPSDRGQFDVSKHRWHVGQPLPPMATIGDLVSSLPRGRVGAVNLLFDWDAAEKPDGDD